MRAALADLEVGRELLAQRGVVLERKRLGVLLDEEVEGIDDRHLGDEPHVHRELRDRLREDRPADHVAERILLAIQAMIGGLDIEPVVMDRRPRMRRREETNHVRGEVDRAVVLVTCRVVERDVNGHQSRQHTLARAVSATCDRVSVSCGGEVSASSGLR